MSKTLRFVGHDLGIDITLILTFAPGEVCWRTIKLGKANHVNAEVTFTPHTAFYVPQHITSRNSVVAGIWQECATGEKCDLIEEEGFLRFTEPVPGPGNDKDSLQCTNKTSTPQTLGVGFYQDDNIEPASIFKDVEADNTLTVVPNLKLSIYATITYKESQLIGEIKSPKLWEQDLGSLVGNVIVLEVSADPAAKEVSIKTK